MPAPNWLSGLFGKDIALNGVTQQIRRGVLNIVTSGITAALADDAANERTQLTLSGALSTPWSSTWGTALDPIESENTDFDLGSGVLRRFWRLEGDSVRIRLSIIGSASTVVGTGGFLSIRLPNGLLADPTKCEFGDGSGNGVVFGTGSYLDSSYVPAEGATRLFIIATATPAVVIVAYDDIAADIPLTDSGKVIVFDFLVPLTGAFVEAEEA
jgi:hypothetical protein